MKHIPCEQPSPEWFAARRGIPTASEFHRILTPKRLEISGEGSQTYINELIGERYATMLPANAESYTSRAMTWGKETEEDARRYFSLQTGYDVKTCGFLMTDDGKFGASPDGLVYDGDKLIGGLELKCPQPPTHVRYVRDDCLPLEYKAQVHGGMFVSMLPRWWFMSYCPGMKPLLMSVVPDSYTRLLGEALFEFDRKLQDALADFRGE
jgi:hypothetical protein